MEVTSIVDESIDTTSTAEAVVNTPPVAAIAPAGPSQPATRRPRRMNGQPTPAYLAKFGIKVRDFAYENTGLPPVRTIYRRQIQPSANRNTGLQRQTTEVAEDGVFSQSQGSSQPLERTVTEPVILHPPPSRQQAFMNLADFIPAGPHSTVSNSTSIPSSGSMMNAISTVAESQNVDGMKTPLVTPNGSLRWESPKNNEALPSTPKSEITVPTFDRGVDKQSLSTSSSRLNIFSGWSSPLSSAPSSPPAYVSPKKSHKSLQRHSSRLLRNHGTQEQRYDLRKRPAKTNDKVTSRPSKRMKLTTPSDLAVHSQGTSTTSAQPANGSGIDGTPPLLRPPPRYTYKSKRGKRRSN